MKLERNIRLLNIAKGILWNIIEDKSTVHIEASEKAIDRIILDNSDKQDSSILYVSTHKSLWETVGIPYSINKFTGDVPYIFAGSNLFKNPFLKFLFNNTGVFPVDRDSTMKSSKKLKNDMRTVLSHGNALLFAEGPRSRNGLVSSFRPAGLEGAIEASNSGKNIYVITANVDYSDVFDLKSMSKTGNGQKFKTGDFFKWRAKNLGDIYISLGDPILIDKSCSREYLANLAREQCMDLVKILPVNVYAKALQQLDLSSGSPVIPFAMYESIHDVIKKLETHKDKFRGFSDNTNPSEIFNKVSPVFGLNKYYTKEIIDKSRIYSNYINHYTDGKY
ncbi:MAG TPA: lysophospholipid acyltransferase family protein [Alphaproteobacteria bacterium]|nr:lysophospholipid acyltransferase family protein [Alphaproteobacteria bacterium]